MITPTPSHHLLALVVVAWVGFLGGAFAALGTDRSWWQAALGGLVGSTATAAVLIGVLLRRSAPRPDDLDPGTAPADRGDVHDLVDEPTLSTPARVADARQQLDLAVRAADAVASSGEQLADSDVAAAVLDVHQARLAYARALLVAGLPLPEELASELIIGNRSITALLASYRSGR